MELIRPLAINMNRLRKERGLTLSGLAQRSGVSKSMLLSIEAGVSTPTVDSLWAIANVLDAPFGQLLQNGTEGVGGLVGADAHVRLMDRMEDDSGGVLEVYDMTIEEGKSKVSAGHAPGVREKLIVTRGRMLAGRKISPKLLDTGEFHAFEADVPHIYSAIEGRVQAMVFVEYPALSTRETVHSHHLEWPRDDAAWDGARCVVDRVCIEVANGSATQMIRFRLSSAAPEEHLRELRAELMDAPPMAFKSPVMIISEIDEDGPFIAVLPQRFTRAFERSSDHSLRLSSLAIAASEISKMVESPLCPERPDLVKSEPRGISWTLESVFSELALHEGELRLPFQLQEMTTRSQGSVPSSTDDESFSSRIQVDHYDAFELLHPAYARQVVAMAQDIADFLPAASLCVLPTIDVGTGPGVPLLMLQEMLPNLRPLAVEPDPVAYACLEVNARCHPEIKLHRGGFLELDHSDGTCQLITSVGSSHHFNTAFMLQKAMRLLGNDGLFCIADEFLPPFHDVQSRNQALVLHHSNYILQSASLLERGGHDGQDVEDRELFTAFRSHLVPAVMHAQRGHVLQAERLCRKLFLLVSQADPSKRVLDAVSAYTRFFWLELQAMVAGFDYEVERKTHVRRFQELAAATGFEIVRHRRVFATHGDDDRDGGTHLITLRKP